jgi:GNAT superfamily N-acetyltransferase
MLFRRATAFDAEAASELIRRAFDTCIAHDWSAAARARFLDEASPAALREQFVSATFAEAACDGTELVGIVALTRPDYLALLFVDPARQRCGIGCQLLAHACAYVETHHADVQTLELNATPASLPFYRAAGFYPISPEYTYRGVRAVRMARWLPYDRLNKEADDDESAAATRT